MIPVGRLKKLLEAIPDEAQAYAYEGESIGIYCVMPKTEEQKKAPFSPPRFWFIQATELDEEDFDTEGFEER